jgi:hypothetical protein
MLFRPRWAKGCFRVHHEINYVLCLSSSVADEMHAACVKLQMLELVLSCATLHFVGWVEPAPSFVGFRCTLPNLHFAGITAKYETRQRPIYKPSPKCFYSDQTGRFFGQRPRSCETSPKWRGFLINNSAPAKAWIK